MTKDHPIRRLYSPEMAEARYNLYRGATARIKLSIDAGFWIEAIALSESVIADRLEARISYLNNDSAASRRHNTIGALARRLKSTELHEGNSKLQNLYDKIIAWSLQRNKAIHNAVKISEGQKIESWEQRYGDLKITAEEGFAIFKALKNEYDKIKRKTLKT